VPYKPFASGLRIPCRGFPAAGFSARWVVGHLEITPDGPETGIWEMTKEICGSVSTNWDWSSESTSPAQQKLSQNRGSSHFWDTHFSSEHPIAESALLWISVIVAVTSPCRPRRCRFDDALPGPARGFRLPGIVSCGYSRKRYWMPGRLRPRRSRQQLCSVRWALLRLPR
jgi:hypothetical protein